MMIKRTACVFVLLSGTALAQPCEKVSDAFMTDSKQPGLYAAAYAALSQVSGAIQDSSTAHQEALLSITWCVDHPQRTLGEAAAYVWQHRDDYRHHEEASLLACDAVPPSELQRGYNRNVPPGGLRLLHVYDVRRAEARDSCEFSSMTSRGERVVEFSTIVKAGRPYIEYRDVRLPD